MQGGELRCLSGWGGSLTPVSARVVPSSSLTGRTKEEIMDSNRQIDCEPKRMRQL